MDVSTAQARSTGFLPVAPLGGRSVVTIGNFDGVHRGHQQLVGGVVRRARSLGTSSVAVTFDPHPLSVLRPEAAPVRLTSLSRRVQLLRDLGLDDVVVLPFTAEVARWEPAEFLQRVLRDTLAAVEVHVGADFRFGHRAAGDVSMMIRAGADHGFTVRSVPLAGEPARWSSTAVRTLLARGDVQGAADVLGRPHRLVGMPVGGLAEEPRAFLVQAQTAVPADGVYAGRLLMPAGARPAVEIQICTLMTADGLRRCLRLHTSAGGSVDTGGDIVIVDIERQQHVSARTADLMESANGEPPASR